MKLKDVLNLPCFVEAKVVAGQDGLERAIRTVNMMDAPDIADFLKSGELLVTTAYSMKDNHEKLERLVRTMTAQGCAGLAIKTKRFLQHIPECVIEVANVHSFPVIELAPHPSLGEVVNETLSLILESKTRELTDALQTQRTWTELILQGRGLHAVVDQFSTLLDATVLIVDEYGTEYALSHTLPGEVHHVLTEQLQEFFQTKRFRNGMQAFSIVGHSGFRSDGRSDIASSDRLTDRSVDRPGGGSRNHSGFRSGGSLGNGSDKRLDKDSEQGSESRSSSYRSTVTLFPIPTMFGLQRYIVILDYIAQDTPASVLIIEQAAHMVALEFMKQHAVQEHIRHMKSDFFKDFLEGNISTEEEVINRGKKFQLNTGQSYLCAIAQIDTDAHTPSAQRPTEEETLRSQTVYEHIEYRLKRLHKNSIVFEKEEQTVILFPVQTNHEESEATFIHTLQSIQQYLGAQANIGLSYGVSQLVHGLRDIPKAYREARNALITGYRARKKRFVQQYRIRQMEELLRMIPHEHLVDFYRNTLQGLIGEQDHEQAELLLTLVTFLDNHCQIGETAKQLYVHRNTVKYRLQKCEMLLGRPLKEADETLQLRMALFIHAILGVNGDRV